MKFYISCRNAKCASRFPLYEETKRLLYPSTRRVLCHHLCCVCASSILLHTSNWQLFHLVSRYGVFLAHVADQLIQRNAQPRRHDILEWHSKWKHVSLVPDRRLHLFIWTYPLSLGTKNEIRRQSRGRTVKLWARKLLSNIISR